MTNPLFPPTSADSFLRRVYEVVNSILDGKVNATGSFTLTNAATSTSVTDPRCSVDSAVLLVPLSSDSAAENTYIVPSNGSFVVYHTNDSTTREFRYAILG